MNLIPKINEKNEVVGVTTIDEAKMNGWYRRIVRVFVFDTNGRLLLQKRSPHVVAFINLWDQSVGGHVDVDETELQAALRETREEIGISVELQEVVNGYRSDAPDDLIFNSVFKAVVEPDQKFIADAEEVSELGWYTIDEFESLLKEQPELFVPTFIVIWNIFKDKLIQ